jgi:septum formation protein
VTLPHPIAEHLDGRPLVLASGSPRRRELVGLLGVAFDVVAPDVDETPLDGEGVDAMVRRLAVAKALAVEAADAIVIGSDTAVELDGEILGKPADLADAMRMLRRLSGRLHRVHTAVAVRHGRHVAVDETVSEVTFVQMTDDEISWYVGTGEPLDKAGAYGLQGIGGAFVESVRGSVTGVLGLPLDVVVRLLADLGVDRPAPRD